MRGTSLQWDRGRALLALALTLVSTAGCSFSRYRYVSVEALGVEVESYATPNLPALYFGSEMPSAYLLDRGRYQLSFRTDLDSYLPRMRIEVEGSAGEVLALSPRASRRSRSDRVVPCGSFRRIEPNEVDFSWVTCAEFDADERYISFDVESEDGALVGREDIPFQLKANGFYVLPDLI